MDSYKGHDYFRIPNQYIETGIRDTEIRLPIDGTLCASSRHTEGGEVKYR